MSSPQDAPRTASPRGPAAPRPVLWRVISLVVALVVTPVAVGTMITGASLSERAFQSTGETDGSGVFLVVAGSAIVSAVACTAFWSSMGVAVEGTLVLVFGLIASIRPSDFAVNPFVTGAFSASMEAWVRVGAPLVLGGLFLVVGGVASVARRRITRGPAVPLVR